MRIVNRENGEIIVKDDWKIASKAEGQDLSTVDISGIRPHAKELADLYIEAGAKGTVSSAMRYVKLRDLYIETFGSV